MRILCIGNDWSSFDTLVGRLGQEDGIHLVYVGSGTAALEYMQKKGKNEVDLVIVGGQLSDMDGIHFVRQLVRINPLVQTAVVGSLPEDAFHEAAEGLGVLLQLPPKPGVKDAEKLLAMLRKISGLMQPEIAEGVEIP